jgi:hypothetical protein
MEIERKMVEHWISKQGGSGHLELFRSNVLDRLDMERRISTHSNARGMTRKGNMRWKGHIPAEIWARLQALHGRGVYNPEVIDDFLDTCPMFKV